MKTNLFGESIFQPGDDVDGVRERLGDAPFEADLSNDEVQKWSGEIRDVDGESVSFADFESQDAAVAWLRGLGDDLEYITDEEGTSL